jgi:hypothetical protein
LVLTACASGTAGTKAHAEIDAELLHKAPLSLPPAVSGRLPDLAENHRQCTRRYQQLATQCNALIDEITPPDARVRWWEFWKDGWGDQRP